MRDKSGRKKNETVRSNHFLLSTEGGTTQGTKGKQEREAHSRAVEGMRRDKSGHQEKVSQGEALTSCRAQEGRTSHDRKRKRDGEGHSQTAVEQRGRDESGQQQKARQRGALTNCREQREGQVRTPRQNETVRGAHSLISASPRTVVVAFTLQSCARAQCATVNITQSLHAKPINKWPHEFTKISQG
jgi:hypothetical protein